MDLTFVMTLTSVFFLNIERGTCMPFMILIVITSLCFVWLANKTRTITERNELEIKNEVYQMFYLYTKTSRTIFLICVKSTLTVS